VFHCTVCEYACSHLFDAGAIFDAAVAKLLYSLVIVLTDKHTAVGVVGDREQMRRHLSTPFASVFADDVDRVDRQTTVRVDDDTEQTGVCLSQSHAALPVWLCYMSTFWPGRHSVSAGGLWTTQGLRSEEFCATQRRSKMRCSIRI